METNGTSAPKSLVLKQWHTSQTSYTAQPLEGDREPLSPNTDTAAAVHARARLRSSRMKTSVAELTRPTFTNRQAAPSQCQGIPEVNTTAFRNQQYK